MNDSWNKRKLILRKFLLDNKEKASSDLEDMRKKSKGDDIYKYCSMVSFAQKYLENCEDIDPEFVDIVNKDFKDLL